MDFLKAVERLIQRMTEASWKNGLRLAGFLALESTCQLILTFQEQLLGQPCDYMTDPRFDIQWIKSHVIAGCLGMDVTVL